MNGSSSLKRLSPRISLFAVSAGLLCVPGHGSLAAQPSRAEKGAAIYAQRCSPCHGENLNNVSGGWSFDLRRLHPDEHDRFVDSVTSGKDNMPSWYGILNTEEIEAIWAYIRATIDKSKSTDR